VGRRRTSKEVRDLIFRMVAENSTWGAPRIHGELLMLGFDISERTISAGLPFFEITEKRSPRWTSSRFPRSSSVCSTVSSSSVTIVGESCTLMSLGIPPADGLFNSCGRLSPITRLLDLIFDRDAKYGLEVPIAVRSMAIRAVRTSFQSPWQNGVAERWIESCRHDLLDHIIALNERHLKRLLSHYVCYYHEDRTHIGLNKGTPAGRVRSMNQGAIVSRARLGGLHHRYDRAA